ncbi:MAG: dTDP-4-amino-4,6-dideoxygalactose transaminase [Oscillospiraceae bacterium]|nr:dTDP-4-amino-4,6-dideoxygalactose transaminase [Oscillospiraceae bacterium]
MIKFNEPLYTEQGVTYIVDAIKVKKRTNGDGEYTNKCNKWIETNFCSQKVLLTTSCTHALEMAALLIEIKEGDEIIMPSYTFVSTANAFVLRGAVIVFVDIRTDTMNMDEKLIEEAITDKTKAIVPVHYAGVSCEMDKIMDIARKYQLYVIEDAAQGVMSKYKDRFLGTIGDIGCFSFHETKNYTMGEGGAVLIKNPDFVERAEIIREKGTNRNLFFRGMVDKYSWVDIGSSYLPSDLNAAYLYAQLEEATEINNSRLSAWNTHYALLKDLENRGNIKLPVIPEKCTHNAHMFYIKTENLEVRTKLIKHLKDNGISAVFHYIPLHSSVAGRKYGRFHGVDKHTTKESERILRLPMYHGITEVSLRRVAETIYGFY